MELELNYTTYIAEAINYLILFIAMVIAFFVFRDAKKHRMSVIEALAWATFSLFTLPIGTLIYIFFGRRRVRTISN